MIVLLHLKMPAELVLHVADRSVKHIVQFLFEMYCIGYVALISACYHASGGRYMVG